VSCKASLAALRLYGYFCDIVVMMLLPENKYDDDDDPGPCVLNHTTFQLENIVGRAVSLALIRVSKYAVCPYFRTFR